MRGRRDPHRAWSGIFVELSNMVSLYGIMHVLKEIYRNGGTYAMDLSHDPHGQSTRISALCIDAKRPIGLGGGTAGAPDAEGQ